MTFYERHLLLFGSVIAMRAHLSVSTGFGMDLSVGKTGGT